MPRLIVRLIVLLLALMVGITVLLLPTPTYAQNSILDDATLNTDCESVRYFMQQSTIPSDLDITGDALSPNNTIRSELGSNEYAETWSFFAEAGQLTVTYNAGTAVEFAVFHGMVRIPDGDGNTNYRSPTQLTVNRTYSLPQQGIYTIVARRSGFVADGGTLAPVTYSLEAQFTSAGDIALAIAGNIGGGASLTPDYDNGHETLSLGNTDYQLNAGSTVAISESATSSQIFFNITNDYRFGVQDWVTDVSFIGGDLAIRGAVNGQQRLLYLQNYDFRVSYTEATLQNIIDAVGTQIVTDWEAVSGLWLFDDCAGVQLNDGRSFFAPVSRDARVLQARGTLDALNIVVSHEFDETTGDSEPYSLTLDWREVGDTEMALLAGQLYITLTDARGLIVEGREIVLRYLDSPSPTSNYTPVDITLVQQDINLTTDWTNLRLLRYADSEIGLGFTERDVTTRSGDNLASIQALQGVTQIVYKDLENGTAGAQRLLLPTQEAQIEIVTPEGLPPFSATALPDQPEYGARALNNLGSTCYPVNTMLPEANCPPNGHPNPANGNVWLGVTDHIASGGLIDLTLTRSYNTRAAGVDGPFGRGWTTDYLLDYAIPFDAEANARVITPEIFRAYPVGLDLTYAPRGIVTYRTGTGSQHVFVSQEPSFNGGQLRAITMPGWTLSRASVMDDWTLTQPDGLTHVFDRAGRLAAYGYPDAGRVVTIRYEQAAADDSTLGIQDGTVVTVTDAAEQRRLELTYANVGGARRIVRSALRDTTALVDGATTTDCEIEAGCYVVDYRYEGDLLTAVTYPEGSTATYQYDDAGRLTSHDDPRMPIAPHMSYAYNDGGWVTQINVEAGDPSTSWRTLEPGLTSDANRETTLTDENNATTTYVYRRTDSPLREPGDSYTLVSVLSPLAEVEPIEAIPQTFTWESGLLTRIDARSLPNNAGGRNSVNYTYTPSGAISSIRYDVPVYSAVYDEAGRLVATGTNDGDEEPDTVYTYNDAGQVSTIADAAGSTTAFTYDGQRRVTSVTQPDGTLHVYTYDALGLVRTTRRTTPGAPESAGAITTYHYDGLGRLTSVTDTTGTYLLDYRPPQTTPDGLRRTVAVTDPAGVVTWLVYNERDQLMEIRVLENENTPDEYLRLRTATYDVYGRVATVSDWLRNIPELDPDMPTSNPPGRMANGQPLTTTVSYEPVDELPSLIETNEEPTAAVLGYRVIVTDAYGRVTRTTYDALGRVRQTVTAEGKIDRFSYRPATSDEFGADFANPLNNTLIIEQRSALNNRIIDEFSYGFDLQGQLRGVRDGAVSWAYFVVNNNSNNYDVLQSPTSDIGALEWGVYDGIRPTLVDVNRRSSPELLSGRDVSRDNPAFSIAYDAAGRPLTITDGNGDIWTAAYCPGRDGGMRRAYNRANRDPVTCETTTPDLSLSYDPTGRLIASRDGTGVQTISYSPQPETHTWLVRIEYTPTNGDMVYTRLQAFDGAGDLRRATDENGFTQSYQHDTLGRLRAVEVANVPEASYRFRYNDAGLLTEAVDGLGRGTFYAYNAFGQITLQQDARTADSVAYAYNRDNQLATIVSPIGSTRTFLYDPNVQDRLIGIIEPTGGQHTFQWVDEPNGEVRNRLIYTDPRGSTTTYRFDSFGLLWRVDDATANAQYDHELHYDALGRLTSWRQAQRNPETVAQNLTLAWDSPFTFTITEPRMDWTQQLGFTAFGAPRRNDNMVMSYDPLQRLTRVGVDDAQWTLTYPTEAPQITLTRNTGNSTTYTFDVLGRQRVIERGEAVTTVDYVTRGVNDLDVVITGASTQTYTLSAGDGLSRLPQIIARAPGQRTRYVLGEDGRITEIETQTCEDVTAVVTDDVQNPDSCVDTGDVWRTESRFVYDASGRLIRVIDAEQNIQTFNYDEANNVLSYQNANGQNFTYSYDTLNRLTRLNTPTGVQLILGYNDLGKVIGICRTRADSGLDFTTCQDTDRLLAGYSYDALGRLVTQSAGVDDTTPLTHVYDPLGRLQAWGLAGTPVERRYQQDGLGRLILVNYGDQPARFSYSLDDHIAFDYGANYTYDQRGRLATVRAGDNGLAFSYLPEERGYTVVDIRNGASMTVALDERGFLQGITTNEGETTIGTTFDYRVTADRQRLIVTVTWQNGDIIELQLNPLLATQAKIDLADNLGFDFITDALGQERRRSVDGPQDYFETGIGGFAVVTGYDNDNRPVTLRVTDRTSNRLLYQTTLTYDEFGQRSGEIRQFEDGTRVDINNSYQGNQLVQRTVEIIFSAGATTALSSLVLLPFGLMLWRRRRWLVVIVATGSIIVALALPGFAQQERAIYTYDYAYDAAGNITRVTTTDDEEPEECVAYTFDNANRLIAVRSTRGTQTYAYDLYNRVTQIGETFLVYQGASRIPLAAITDDATVFYGQASNIPPLFYTTGQEADTVRLRNDGRGNIVAVDSDAIDQPLWLFDPVGRFLTLTPPSIENPDACDLFALPDRVRSTSLLPVVQRGLLWDTTTDVLFAADGRAYTPNAGTFLQRDPLGLDAFGNVYAFPSRQVPGLVRRASPAYRDGLNTLDAALSIANIEADLTADAVRERFYPQLPTHPTSPIFTGLAASRSQVVNTLNKQLNFPVWATAVYNRPIAYQDTAGRLRSDTAVPPGHGMGDGRVLPHLPDVGVMFALETTFERTAPGLPLDRLANLTAYRVVPATGITSFVGYDWLSSARLTTAIHLPPQNVSTPADVLDWLPRVLTNPESAAITLTTIEELQGLPALSTGEVLDSVLIDALPSAFVPPPENLNAYLETLFTIDFSGVGEQLARRYDVPPAPELPVYRIGDNVLWRLDPLMRP